jgi:hypothetical protein
MAVIKIVPFPGPRGNPDGYINQVIITSLNQTVGQLSHAGKHLYLKSGGQSTFMIPTDAAVPFAIGTQITFITDATSRWLFNRVSTGTTTVVGEGAGYNASNANFVLPSNARATLLKIEANRWILSGVRVNV